MPNEMTIPRSLSEDIFHYFIASIVVVASFLAVMNLVTNSAVIADIMWFCVVAFLTRTPIQAAGGFRQWQIGWLGKLAGRRYAAFTDTSLPQVRLGFELFGHRFVRDSVPVDRIESIEWNPGQGIGWNVVLWFDHGNPQKSARRASLRKPDQDVLIVGSPRRREFTEAFAHTFVDFLREGGAHLVPHPEQRNCFVRAG
jgi:hypothetical protein